MRRPAILLALCAAVTLPVPIAAVCAATTPVRIAAARAAATPQAGAPQATAPEASTSHDATAHHPFTDVEKWVKVFDDPKRDEWQKPAEVAAALRLSPGMIVADLGAGTGYFESHLARAVSPGGIVLAIDTEPKMVGYLRTRIGKERLQSVLPILAAPEDPFLPRGRVDRVLIVDTYHHIDDRLTYFGRMKEALAPKGLVAIVDFHKKPLPVGPPPEHKLPREFVIDEMRRAGFSLAEEKTFLPYQYFLLFEPAPH